MNSLHVVLHLATIDPGMSVLRTRLGLPQPEWRYDYQVLEMFTYQSIALVRSEYDGDLQVFRVVAEGFGMTYLSQDEVTLVSAGEFA